MIFLLKCPSCKNDMKYATNGSILEKKQKKCVYCGKSFAVKNSVIQRIKV
ncbi:hypothetical protein KY330_01045 [Candidatus Woesearchaeota archaeon]|nr:hypothetical protein [Candidatus Woesearchaeota archaeon]